MGRLRQQNPQGYNSSPKINDEFENLIRYINTAERGNRTLGELLRQIYDDNGTFTGNIELRLDPTEGLQYRTGSNLDITEGWRTIAATADLRGPSGSVVGEIPLPIFYQRADYSATAGQTVFAYTHLVDDYLIVYKNGILQRPGALFDYTSDATADTITFTTACALNDKIVVMRARGDGGVQFNRTDMTIAGSQTVIPYAFPNGTYQLLVYKNGLIQAQGGSADYILNIGTSTITFTSNLVVDDVVTIIAVVPTSADTIPGIMLEGVYTDPQTGLINWEKLGVNDNEIPTTKVNGLAARLDATPRIFVDSVTPTSVVSGDLWLDTSTAPNALKYYDGTQFLLTSPETSIPPFGPANAYQYLRVNSTGTALAFGAIDLSGVIARTERGAANGVAPLDVTGRLPSTYLPETIANQSVYFKNSGATTDGSYLITRIFLERRRITGISCQTASGTCTIQLSVGGVAVGSTFSVSSATNNSVLGTTIEIDATINPRDISVIVSSASSANNLEITLATQAVST